LPGAGAGNEAIVPRIPVLVASAIAAVMATTTTACVEPRDHSTMAPVEASAQGEGLRTERAVRPRALSPSWTGPALDGRPVTISAAEPPPGVGFVGGLPDVIARIDKLARAGDCESLTDQLAFWRYRASIDVRFGATASAFAQRTLEVSAFIGCTGVLPAPSG
jgi:hypothetical protein